jgi:hypothetical protein
MTAAQSSPTATVVDYSELLQRIREAAGDPAGKLMAQQYVADARARGIAEQLVAHHFGFAKLGRTILHSMDCIEREVSAPPAPARDLWNGGEPLSERIPAAPARDAILAALIRVGHKITIDEVTFYRDSSKDSTTLAQICDSLESAFAAAPSAPQAVEADKLREAQELIGEMYALMQQGKISLTHGAQGGIWSLPDRFGAWLEQQDASRSTQLQQEQPQ